MALSAHSWHSIRLSAHGTSPVRHLVVPQSFCFWKGARRKCLRRRLRRVIAAPPNNPPSIYGKLWKIMENYRKSWKIMAIIIIAFFGHFMVKLYLNNIFNGLIDFFCFIFGLIKSRFHYFKYQFFDLSWFLDFWTYY